MQETLLANPGPITYLHVVFVVALENRVMPDIHVTAYGNIFWMENQYASLKHDMLAKRSEIAEAKRTSPM
jgi:hypothetical protein